MLEIYRVEYTNRSHRDSDLCMGLAATMIYYQVIINHASKRDNLCRDYVVMSVFRLKIKVSRNGNDPAVWTDLKEVSNSLSNTWTGDHIWFTRSIKFPSEFTEKPLQERFKIFTNESEMTRLMEKYRGQVSHLYTDLIKLDEEMNEIKNAISLVKQKAETQTDATNRAKILNVNNSPTEGNVAKLKAKKSEIDVLRQSLGGIESENEKFNMLVLLSSLFPTTLPRPNNIYDKISGTLSLNAGFKMMRAIKRSFGMLVDKEVYSYVGNDTILRVVWNDDVFSHPWIQSIISAIPDYVKWVKLTEPQLRQQRSFVLKRIQELDVDAAKAQLEELHKGLENLLTMHNDSSISFTFAQYSLLKTNIEAKNAQVVRDITVLDSNKNSTTDEEIQLFTNQMEELYNRFTEEEANKGNRRYYTYLDLVQRFGETKFSLRTLMEYLKRLIARLKEYKTKERLSEYIRFKHTDDEELKTAFQSLKIDGVKEQFSTFQNLFQSVTSDVKYPPHMSSSLIFAIQNQIRNPDVLNKNWYKNNTMMKKAPKSIPENENYTGLTSPGIGKDYEVYLAIDFITGKITNENSKQLGCALRGERLGSWLVDSRYTMYKVDDLIKKPVKLKGGGSRRNRYKKGITQKRVSR
jgi:hypothetical protein